MRLANMYLNQSSEKFEILVAKSFLARAGGLLFRKKLMSRQCLLITPCRSIHTIGMRYSIDIIFIDAFGYITDIYYDVKPFKVVSASAKACSVVEFLGGTLGQFDLDGNRSLFRF
ncbi:DUF192 domain-containing protein [Acinetobacter sp. C26M]|uniref:DUF192 domain-containing protein n=1 Tax=unclassified Acinetobacter TaxID=196816 RepID=UPI00203755AF|nr:MULTISPECIES: DUF192 domain-containing protein [unclassified Acinetobacter]USA45365.1 DUF192 domain-containing protein [Acinetobacter sp. C26M]USA48867.1 DUF192 domain-containing protein [Acinetobacter sp. C26G]